MIHKWNKQTRTKVMTATDSIETDYNNARSKRGMRVRGSMVNVKGTRPIYHHLKRGKYKNKNKKYLEGLVDLGEEGGGRWAPAPTVRGRCVASDPWPPPSPPLLVVCFFLAMFAIWWGGDAKFSFFPFFYLNNNNNNCNNLK